MPFNTTFVANPFVEFQNSLAEAQRNLYRRPHDQIDFTDPQVEYRIWQWLISTASDVLLDGTSNVASLPAMQELKANLSLTENGFDKNVKLHLHVLEYLLTPMLDWEYRINPNEPINAFWLWIMAMREGAENGDENSIGKVPVSSLIDEVYPSAKVTFDNLNDENILAKHQFAKLFLKVRALLLVLDPTLSNNLETLFSEPMFDSKSTVLRLRDEFAMSYLQNGARQQGFMKAVLQRWQAYQAETDNVKRQSQMHNDANNEVISAAHGELEDTLNTPWWLHKLLHNTYDPVAVFILERIRSIEGWERVGNETLTTIASRGLTYEVRSHAISTVEHMLSDSERLYQLTPWDRFKLRAEFFRYGLTGRFSFQNQRTDSAASPADEPLSRQYTPNHANTQAAPSTGQAQQSWAVVPYQSMNERLRLRQ